MPPKQSGSPRRGDRGGSHYNSQTQPSSTATPQETSASSSPESFYGQPDDTPSSDLVVTDQQMGPGWDPDNPDHVARWHQYRRRDHDDDVDTMEGGGQSADNVQGQPVPATGAAEERGVIPDPFGNGDEHGFSEVEIDLYASSQNAGNVQGPSVHATGAAEEREETPAAAEESGSRDEEEVGSNTSLYDSSEDDDDSIGQQEYGASTGLGDYGTRRDLDDVNATNQERTSSSQAAQPAEANPAQTGDAQGPQETTPPQERWAPVPQNTPEAPSQIGGAESSSPTPARPPRAIIDDSGTSPGTPSPGSDTSTPPAPGAGDGPRHQSRRDSGSPLSPGSRAQADTARDNSAPAGPPPPAQETLSGSEDAQHPDVPRASVERDTAAAVEEVQAQPGVSEEAGDTEENNGTGTTGDFNGNARRKRSGAPEPSSSEDEGNGVDGEPPKKRRKDDKDDDRNGDWASTAVDRAIPQFMALETLETTD